MTYNRQPSPNILNARPATLAELEAISLDDVRIVPCEACGTEGRIIRQSLYHSSAHVGAPDEVDHGECPYCEGTGGELIEVEPIELEDLP